MNRSWAVEAQVDVPRGGAEGPIVVMGGDTNGWSLYLKEGKPTFCYNLASVELTYIRAAKPVASGRHVVRYEFEKRGKEPFGAGGIGRIFVDGQKVAEGEIPTTTAFGYSLDETFDIGCDKGAPVTDEYPPLASFTGKIVRSMSIWSRMSRPTRPVTRRSISAGHAAPVATATLRVWPGCRSANALRVDLVVRDRRRRAVRGREDEENVVLIADRRLAGDVGPLGRGRSPGRPNVDVSTNSSLSCSSSRVAAKASGSRSTASGS